ncbi:alpha/beta fold hydrolase [Oculatella sp. FACHB-28]|uniref:alpha/beta fold hydrolase n=1 Tax=Cyanophyceae TaxID=3028117 RepID=UPI00168489B3|nr:MULTISPECIES: alpha/beta fold hydrolase [Cyanophyceae]MBD2056561.1 alpha/beta fold hydrolase [Oculatella sp. FACHB-28]MBD2071770.1 alpha/beta fold hydrolase [Leptolyngbya sp. FACHB-671]
MSLTSNLPAAVSSFSPSQTWMWKGFPICYQAEGESGPAVVLIHGFGASWQHWRKNIPALAESCRVYAIDLIGFGSSAKPVPFSEIEYTFETWAQQVADFCQEVVGAPAYLVGNSIGCIVAMQTAVSHADSVLGIAMLNCSLRLLHDRRRATLPWYRRMGAPLLQRVLAVRWLGHNFFRLIARPNTVRKILLKAYIRPEAVTDELVDMLMAPAADAGAADVFLAFTGYSQGPLPEDLLEVLPCPAILLWGTQDPWEPIALGRDLANFPAVKEFIPLEGVGHCPQDEAPELVNPILQEWILSQASTHETY